MGLFSSCSSTEDQLVFHLGISIGGNGLSFQSGATEQRMRFCRRYNYLSIESFGNINPLSAQKRD
jgi:hypothetical protein